MPSVVGDGDGDCGNGYDCFTTGFKTGFIEVIKDSLTLFKIQMEGGIKGRYQIDTTQLFKWIASNNPTEKK